MNILIADDSPMMLSLLRPFLESEGWTVWQADNGLQAWEMLTIGPLPDLCILDIDMRPMDGLELVEKMRKDPMMASLRVIFLTGNSMREIVVKAAQLKPSGYMVKPFDRGKLIATVKQAMNLT